jgi:hypothetical protein
VRARVRAAFFADAERTAAPLVRAALRAAAERCVRLRLPAAERACRARAWGDAALWPSRFKADVVARRRLAVVLRRAGAPWPRA